MPSAITPSIRVRSFNAGDARALIEIFRGAVRVVARRDYTLEQVTAWAPDNIDVKSWELHCTGKETFVAEIEGVAVGFSDLEADGHLDMMFVHPEFQGRGVASALLCRVESAARAWDLKRLFSESSITARPFFEHRGFRMIAAQSVSIRGQEFINYRMEKDL